jgi:RNA polymerase sigma-70 factor, ECF subfamily
MDTVTDDDLILMYGQGDAEAFEVLFDRHHTSVYNFAHTMLGPADGAAEEVMQETFLAVAHAAGQYAPRGQFRSWLMRIVRNRCLNRIQSQRARQGLLAGGGPDVAELPCDEPTPPRRAEAAEQAAVVRAAVADLPDRQREAIALYAFEEMTYRQIAGILDMPINTVKTLIHRARAALAQSLEKIVKEQKGEL